MSRGGEGEKGRADTSAGFERVGVEDEPLWREPVCEREDEDGPAGGCEVEEWELMPDVRRELRFPLDGMVMIVCGEQELLRLPGCGQKGGEGKARSRPSAELEHESQACELPGVRDLVTLADA